MSRIRPAILLVLALVAGADALAQTAPPETSPLPATRPGSAAPGDPDEAATDETSVTDTTDAAGAGGIADYFVREADGSAAPSAPSTNLGSAFPAVPRRAPLPGRVVTGAAPGASLTVLLRSPRPEARPDDLPRPVPPTMAAAGTVATPRPISGLGAICGDETIRGKELAPIPGRVAGCGVAEPVEVREVTGIRLSQAAVMDCTTARALKTWILQGAAPIVGRLGGGIDQFRVAAHYACRPRNNQAGAKISEHGKGHAIDISAIRLRNGVSITVLDGWNDRLHGPLLRRMHDAACGPFGTVLGPGANALHRDHFHFDTARYRAGSYCR